MTIIWERTQTLPAALKTATEATLALHTETVRGMGSSPRNLARYLRVASTRQEGRAVSLGCSGFLVEVLNLQNPNSKIDMTGSTAKTTSHTAEGTQAPALHESDPPPAGKNCEEEGKSLVKLERRDGCDESAGSKQARADAVTKPLTEPKAVSSASQGQRQTVQ